MGLILTVIIFVLSIILLIIIKPNFLYNKKKQKFKQFGYGKNKTILTLPILSIFVSVIVFIFSYFIKDDDNSNSDISVVKTITPPISVILPQQQHQIQVPNIITPPNQQFINIDNIDIKSLLEAGIKAKLMENMNSVK